MSVVLNFAPERAPMKPRDLWAAEQILRDDRAPSSHRQHSSASLCEAAHRELEAELDRTRKLLWAAEDIILEDRRHLARLESPYEPPAPSRLLPVSLLLNLCATAGLCYFLLRRRVGS